MKQEDKILKMFFEPERWQRAISKGIDKDIRKDQLYRLTTPEVRSRLYLAIRDGKYRISPPHTALIPKDNGDFRTVYVNEPVDRVVLSITNDLLFELMPDMVHPRCRSYQKGIGCGRVVKEVSARVCGGGNGIVGWKSDLSKYFDTVPLHYIDEAFDKVEAAHGHSALVDVLRDYYHSNLFFDTDGILQSSYQSLKQGCAVAAWLADVVIRHIDEKLAALDGYYVRYSDDMLFVGRDYGKAMEILRAELMEMQMTLNPRKVEYLDHDHWFKFLGYSIKGHDISLSATRLKTFQREIERCTVKRRDNTFTRAVNAVNRYLYKGCGDFSWATQILPVVNVRKDIDTLNTFVIDCLRAVQTGKHKIGGLGFVKTQFEGCIQRGRGRNVRANRQKTPQRLQGYLSIGCMQQAMLTRRAAYNTLVATL